MPTCGMSPSTPTRHKHMYMLGVLFDPRSSEQRLLFALLLFGLSAVRKGHFGLLRTTPPRSARDPGLGVHQSWMGPSGVGRRQGFGGQGPGSPRMVGRDKPRNRPPVPPTNKAQLSPSSSTRLVGRVFVGVWLCGGQMRVCVYQEVTGRFFVCNASKTSSTNFRCYSYSLVLASSRPTKP